MSAFNLTICGLSTHAPPASENRMAKSFEILMTQVPSLKTTLDSGDVGEIETFYQNVSVLYYYS